VNVRSVFAVPRSQNLKRAEVRTNGQRRSQAAPEGKKSPDEIGLSRAKDRAAAGPMRRQLALALARAGQVEEAREVVRDLLTEMPPDAETLGLVGHIHKNIAARSDDAEKARAHLCTALDFYLDGYQRDGNPYCGINAASLHALLEERKEATAIAKRIWNDGQTDDAFWHAAIRAEAALLLGDLPEAKKQYTACAALGHDRADDVQSAWAQARRLCGFLYGDACLVDPCFGDAKPKADSLAGQLRVLRQTLESDEDTVADSDLSALRSLAQELLRMQEEQRHTLSRELHDNIAQLLAVTSNRIASAHRSTTSKRLKDELAHVRSAVQQALDEVSNLSRSLRPSLLDQAGLAAALEKHAAAFRERVKLTLHIECHAPSAGQLDGERATNLFRIAQEALHNIEKHAQATEARLKLHEDGEALHLEIADNGCSFHPECADEAKRNGRLGLIGMRERAEMLGGKLEIHAQPGNGTVVRAAVPCRT